MTLPFVLSRNSVSVFLDGTPEVIDNSHPNFDKIVAMLRAGVNTIDQAVQLEQLISLPKTIQKAVSGTQFGDVTVGVDAVLYKGNPINSYLTQSMLEIIKQGFDVTPWARFMDKLYKNPSKTAVDELFLWLDKAGMPITQDGNFLAYKKVKDDYSSYHKAPGGKVFMNTPGAVVEMPRNEVDDNRNQTCSTGLHFCSWHYLPSYYGDSGKVVLVEIDPADVVSIPSDYDNAKGRAAKYRVVGEIDQAKAEFAFAGATIVDFNDEYDTVGWF